MSITHHILIAGETRTLHHAARQAARLVRRSIRTALRCEGVTVSCEVNVQITDDRGIHKLNREQRGVDAPTDVLSFPAFQFQPEAFDASDGETDPQNGLLPLGDMALNLDRIRAQALEYGHSEERETAYLTVHSVLHLLGYDHMDEGQQKRQMRAHEEIIMRELGL